MHIPDGFLDPKISSGLLGAAVGILGVCLSKVMKAVTAVVPQRQLAAAGNRLGNATLAAKRVLTGMGESQLRRAGIVAAWLFAVQMFNFPVANGTSGHLIGGVFAGVLLGPYLGTLVLAVVLLAQAWLFADGGWMAWGANVINMAVLGSFAGYFIYAGLRKVLPEIASVAAAAWLSVVLAALACALEIGLSGTADLQAVTLAMVTVHALIGVAEAVLTVMLIYFFKRSESQ